MKDKIFSLINSLSHLKLTRKQQLDFLKDLYYELKKHYGQYDWTERLADPENDPKNYKLSAKEQELLRRITQ